MKFNENRSFGVELEIFFTNGTNRYKVADTLQEKGIQCAVEGYNHNTETYWKIVPDSSIRNFQGTNDERYCMEVVSPPLQGREGLEELRKVADILRELGAKVNKTCGLHVHHDIRDYDLEDFKSLFILYTKCEPAMDALVPASRRSDNNTYCRSLRSQNIFYWIHRASSVRSIADHLCMEVGSSRARYLKLNIMSYFQYGTIEFRQHSGTVDSGKIINWVVFTQAMVNAAGKFKPRATYFRNDTAEGTLHYLRNVITKSGALNQCDDLVRQAIKFQYKRRRQLQAREAQAV